MVPSIEKLRPELQCGFLGESRVFEERDVPVIGSPRRKNISTAVTPGSRECQLERTGIEITLHSPVTTGQHTGANAVCILFSATKGTGLGTVAACDLHRKGSSTGECHNRAGLPTLDNRVDPSRQIAEVLLTTTEGEKVYRTEHKSMPLIEGRGAIFRT